MKANFKNTVDVRGTLFSLGNDRNRLSQKISRKGVAYISGDLNVDTGDNNVVTLHYTYVPEKFNSGKDNSTYQNLTQIINDERSIEKVGRDSAMKLRVSGDLETNDFWSTRNNEFVAAARVRGNFVHEDFSDATQAEFTADALISSVQEVERDDEQYVILHAYVFDWRNNIMPFNFEVHNENGKNYFLDADISNKNPMLTTVWGNIVNKTITTYETKESAWGEAQRTPVTRNVRYYEVVGSSPEPMEFDDESTLTKSELKQLLQERQERLEESKQRSEEYRSNQNHGGNAFAGNTTAPAPEADDDDDDIFPF